MSRFATEHRRHRGTEGWVRDALADRDHAARHAAARSERQRRTDPVGAAYEEPVDEADTDGRQLDEDLAGPRPRCRFLQNPQSRRIEDAEGLANALDIARSSTRVEALIFGAGDLSVSLQARVDGNFDPLGRYPGDFWHFARTQVLTAARAAGVAAVDAPFPAYGNPDGYRSAATQAALLGFDGKWAIHPSQVPLANDAFTPTSAEAAAAQDIVERYRRAAADGTGAIAHDGRLVDAAHARLAANVLTRARTAASGPVAGVAPDA